MVTSTCASLVSVMSSTLPIGCPATSTWFPLTSCPPFSNMRWYLCPELPPNSTTSTSTNPTKRAPPVKARANQDLRPVFKGGRSGVTCQGPCAPLPCQPRDRWCSSTQDSSSLPG